MSESVACELCGLPDIDHETKHMDGNEFICRVKVVLDPVAWRGFVGTSA